MPRAGTVLTLLTLVLLPSSRAWTGEPTPQADDGHFERSLLADPPAYFWPAYFWVLNDKLDEPRLIEQLHDMFAHGARSVCILPEPPEFRPGSVDSHLDQPYLGENYFAVIERLVAECRRLGMHFWLYDEGGWPSGGACGQVYAKNPQRFVPKQLVSHAVSVEAGQAYMVPMDAVGAAVSIDHRWGFFAPGQEIPAISQARQVHLFQAAPAPGDPRYADLLCEDATRTFLELTHAGYQRHIGSSFGKNIFFTFTDEPAVRSTQIPQYLTWTDDLADEFRTRKGYDLGPWLPVLFECAAEDAPAVEPRERARVLIDFYDTWSQLFVERFLRPVQTWCAANGLWSGGHFGGEDEPIYNAVGGYGHILRALRGLDLPGTDTIWRQIHPGVHSEPFAKYASSIAAQKGQRHTFTESFAVYGSGLTTAEMKWITDHQYVRGTTLTVAAVYPYATHDHYMPGERPNFGPSNPLWKYCDLFHAYTARLGYLLSRGQPCCSTAVYYDVRSIWAGEPWRGPAIQRHRELAQALLARQQAFDFVDDDLLASREGQVASGRLRVGPMTYDTILVPATDWMERPALEHLVPFVREGGTLVLVGGGVACDGGTTDFWQLAGISPPQDGAHEIAFGQGQVVVATPDEAAAIPQPLLQVAPATTALRALKRSWAKTALYYLVNQEEASLDFQLTISEPGPVSICDPEDGRLEVLDSQATNRGTQIRLRLPRWGSAVLLTGMTGEQPSRPAMGRELLCLTDGWTLQARRRYWVGETDFQQADLPEVPATPVTLGDWQPVLGANFSGDAEYAVDFRWLPATGTSSLWLDLGRVNYACEVRLNGQVLGRRAWDSFALEIPAGLLRETNQLRVIVTNTLANALLDPEVRQAWTSRKGPGWPSNGQPYDARAIVFEKDSLPSGLFGPVRILTGNP